MWSISASNSLTAYNLVQPVTKCTEIPLRKRSVLKIALNVHCSIQILQICTCTCKLSALKKETFITQLSALLGELCNYDK